MVSAKKIFMGISHTILSQKVPKFELYKHNGELFNIYYGIFYQLWTFAYFDRLCKLEKRGDEIKKKKFSSETTEPISTKLLKWSLCGPNPVIYVKKLTIMLIQFKFGHFLA
jgi:hypothetical protein